MWGKKVEGREGQQIRSEPGSQEGLDLQALEQSVSNPGQPR